MAVRPLQLEPEPPPPRAAPQLPLKEIGAALGAIAAILGARMILLAALVFAFILSQSAQANPTGASNWALGLFLVFGFMPVVGLATFRRV